MSEPSDNLPQISIGWHEDKDDKVSGKENNYNLNNASAVFCNPAQVLFFEIKYKYNAYNIEEMHIINLVHVEETHTS